MGDTSSNKRRANEEPPMLTPPTPKINSFSQSSSSDEVLAANLPSQPASLATATRVTPPSTASPLKHPRDTVSPDRQQLAHDGITSFPSADPTVVDLLVAATSSPCHLSEHRTASTSSGTSPSPNSDSPEYRNNTIVNTIRELGYRKYLQKVNPPRFLPAKLRAAPVIPEPSPPAPRKPAQQKKKQPAMRPKSRNAKKPPVTSDQTLSKKRKLSETEPVVTRASALKARMSEGPLVVETQEPPAKKAKTAPPAPPALPVPSVLPVPPALPATPPTKTTVAKPKSRNTPKKTTNIGASKPEKSRTKEQRWGDYLKSRVGGDKDAYQKLPDFAVPALGPLIDQVPVRPYNFNKGKVQEYGDDQGLHAREMELAREVGLSYNAYRQQKRMAFIGYAAMQLEGKKDFKKSHTQSMCNIDGNKATHLWVHFHDCWGWMPENPTPPITISSLGDLQLPDLHVTHPQQ